MDLTDFVKKNKIFFIPVLILIITGIVFLTLFARDVIHITHNQWNNKTWDYFFTYITLLGEGFIFPLIAIAMGFVKWRYLIGFIIASLLTLLIVGLLKNFVFDDFPRPASYFEDKYELHLVEGVEVHKNNSFPSGHTTFAFAAWSFVAFVSRFKIVKFSCFFIASLVGYSRLYLSQHFLMDVLAGCALGVLLACTAYLFSLHLKFKWSDRSLRFKVHDN